MFQSETYSVIDGTFKDIGTETVAPSWTNSDFTGSAKERNGEYTTLIPQDNFDECDLAISGDLCVEFDVNLTWTSAENNFIRFCKNRWTSVLIIRESFLGLTNGQWSHVKFTKTGTTVDITVDGQSKPSQSLSNTIDTFMIVLDNTRASNLKYKNFVVYPI